MLDVLNNPQDKHRAERELAMRVLYSSAPIKGGAYAILERAAFGHRPIHDLDIQRIRRIAARAGVA